MSMSDTSKREELIEEHRGVIAAFGDMSPIGNLSRRTIRALEDAVFEQAHTPSDDEREELADIVLNATVPYKLTDSWGAADAILAAGFRRTAVQEPSDELPEVDADPDTAFELGRVAGYDEAMREMRGEPSAEPDTIDGKCLSCLGECVSGYHCCENCEHALIGQEEKR